MHDPPRILIVDDNEHNRAILAARLGAQGYSTMEACDGVEALEAARRDAPDLILLDVEMPRMDGLEGLPAAEERREVSGLSRSFSSPPAPTPRMLSLASKRERTNI